MLLTKCAWKNKTKHQDYSKTIRTFKFEYESFHFTFITVWLDLASTRETSVIFFKQNTRIKNSTLYVGYW